MAHIEECGSFTSAFFICACLHFFSKLRFVALQLFVRILFLRFALKTQHKAVGAYALPPRYVEPAVAGALLPTDHKENERRIRWVGA